MTLVLPPMVTMLAFKSMTKQLRSMTALTLRPGNALILQPSLTPAPVKLILDTSTHTGVIKPLLSQSHSPLLHLPMPRLWPPLAFQTELTHGATLQMALPLSLPPLTTLQLPPARLLPLTTPRPVPLLAITRRLSTSLMAASLRALSIAIHTPLSFAQLRSHLVPVLIPEAVPCPLVAMQTLTLQMLPSRLQLMEHSPSTWLQVELEVASPTQLDLVVLHTLVLK